MVARDLSPVVRHLKQAFEATSHNRLQLIVTPCRRLSSEAAAGLSTDIILSSDFKETRDLSASGQCQKSEVFALAQLAFWSQKPVKADLFSFLTESNLQKLVLLPSSSPTGQAGQDWLHENGYWPTVRQKVLYMENRDSIYYHIRSGSIDIAIIGNSAIQSSCLQYVGHWTFLPNKLLPQAVCITPHGAKRRKKATKNFYSFLLSEKAQPVLQGHGYLPPPNN